MAWVMVTAALEATEAVVIRAAEVTAAAAAAALLDGFDAGREIVLLSGGTRKAKAEGLPMERTGDGHEL